MRSRLVDRLPCCIVLVVLAASMATEAPARLGFTPCIFRNVTGLPCPGCGMTRGFVAVGHGRLPDAFRANLLAPPFFLAACAYVAWSLIARLRPTLSWPRPSPRARALFYGTVLALIAVSWTLSLYRHFS